MAWCMHDVVPVCAHRMENDSTPLWWHRCMGRFRKNGDQKNGATTPAPVTLTS